MVLQGEAEIQVGAEWVRLHRGGLAFAPRWIVHQSRNVSAEEELLLLAITDFGLTSSVLGDYDRQTRLRFAGRDSCSDPRHESAPAPPSPVGPTERRGLFTPF